MFEELRENAQHGTKAYPYGQYFIRKRWRAFQFPMHWHEELEIIYVRTGRLDVRITGRDYSGKAGSVFFVNPRELHMMGSDDLSVTYYTLLFPLELISFQTLDELENGVLQPLRSGQLLLPADAGALAADVTPILDRIIAVNDAAAPQRQLETRILLLQMLKRLLERDALTPAASGSGADMQRELLAYIQAHYDERITLKQLADRMHMSEKYVSRYFKSHFALPFSRYVLHLRLEHARQLLETTETPVTEVALQVGFSSVSYFIRAFRDVYGVPPLRYRRGRQ
ncbi:MAG: AraC family transcriptional regulator [Clostridia bacterium]|nr:AraC family transcriptional regulator [Clostridia bacterium]